MTKPLLTFNRDVYICWEDRKGRDWETYVNVTYTYDGSELTITRQNCADDCYDLSDDQFNELVYEAVEAEADERYLDEVGEDA